MKFLNYFRGETFARGIHPPQHKETATLPIRRLPVAPRLIVHLSQPVGRPARRKDARFRLGRIACRQPPMQ